MKKVHIFLTVSALIIATAGYSSPNVPNVLEIPNKTTTKKNNLINLDNLVKIKVNPLLTAGFNPQSQPSDLENTVPNVLKVLKNLQTTTTLHPAPCTVYRAPNHKNHKKCFCFEKKL